MKNYYRFTRYGKQHCITSVPHCSDCKGHVNCLVSENYHIVLTGAQLTKIEKFLARHPNLVLKDKTTDPRLLLAHADLANTCPLGCGFNCTEYQHDPEQEKSTDQCCTECTHFMITGVGYDNVCSQSKRRLNDWYNFVL